MTMTEPSPGEGGAQPGTTPKTLYFLADGLGSTIGLLTYDGRISARYSYDEFGIVQSSKKFDINWPGPDNMYGYTGLEYEYYSDLNYARARYYKAEIGRFISEDSYLGDMWNPQSQNLYTYVHNNPLIYVDPTGKAPSLKELNSTLKLLGGVTDPIARGIAFGSVNIANTSRNLASKYAKENDPDYTADKVLITWDNTADALRHFHWNASMSQLYGKENAEIVSANHEFMSSNYSVLSIDKSKATLEIQLATLMDLHNNKVGFEMGASNPKGDPYKLFEQALEADKLITSLDQVASVFNFNPNLVYINKNQKEVVRVTLHLRNPDKGVTFDDFYNIYFSSWSFGSQSYPWEMM